MILPLYDVRAMGTAPIELYVRGTENEVSEGSGDATWIQDNQPGKKNGSKPSFASNCSANIGLMHF